MGERKKDVAEWIWGGNDFYDQQINFLNNDQRIQNMKAEYGEIINDFLTKNKDEWWEKDIVEIAKALKNNEDLAYYVLYLLRQQDLIIDDKIQLAKLKNELDRNVNEPSFEIMWWEVEVYSLKIKWFKIKWSEKTKISVRVNIKEMPELWWYEITYKRWYRENKLYINYQGRDKIGFYEKYNDRFLGNWNIQYKSRDIQSWKFYRNGQYMKKRTTQTALVSFELKDLKLKLDFKFYDYKNEHTD